jgi:hypothetical protein
MADQNEVALPYRYYPDPTKGRPVFNGSIYVGKPDTDPQITSNQLTVLALQEDGSTVSIAQPIRTGAGGVPMLNGSAVQLSVDGEYSMKVLNSMGAQVYYAPSLVSGLRPTTIVRTQTVPMSVQMTNRFVNSSLFDTNTSWSAYYAANKPNMNLGALSNTTFNIENIPSQRFDLAQGNSTTNLGGLN